MKKFRAKCEVQHNLPRKEHHLIRLYINQYGGAGGSLKFWNSGSNLGDAGSAFTVFDVPTNFASYVVNEITPSMEATGYFTFTDAAKATIGYDDSKKTECSFDDYKSIKENMAAAMSDPSNFVLPETGFYLLKNKNYNTFMGIDPSDLNMYGNYNSANLPKQIIKLTKTGDKTYTISLEGVFAPATVAKSTPVTATTEAGTYTVSVPAVGYAAFLADPESQYSGLHLRSEGDIVGWEAAATASQWEVIDAAGTEIEIAISDAGYATTYLPFDVTVPTGVTANAVTINADGVHLDLNSVGDKIPAGTPVLLEGNANTYSFAITTGGSYAGENVLVGTYTPIVAPDESYILQKQNDKVGFYQVDYAYLTAKGIDKPNVPANRAYLTVPAGGATVKAFFFNGGEDGISTIGNAGGKNVIYNIAGQRVQKAQKGLYIVNGKKVIVK